MQYRFGGTVYAFEVKRVAADGAVVVLDSVLQSAGAAAWVDDWLTHRIEVRV